MTAFHVKAGHTSDFVRILTLQSASPIQPGKICSLAESAPTDGLTLIVRNQASHNAVVDHRTEPFLGLLSFDVLPFLSRLDPPPHTPTAAAGTLLSKKLFQVFPQAGSHFFYLNFHPACETPPEKPVSLRIRTAAATNSLLEAATEPSGRALTSSKPMRVEKPDSSARRANGHADALSPCKRIGRGKGAFRSTPIISSATAWARSISCSPTSIRIRNESRSSPTLINRSASSFSARPASMPIPRRCSVSM